jgi:hypothetical protein
MLKRLLAAEGSKIGRRHVKTLTALHQIKPTSPRCPFRRADQVGRRSSISGQMDDISTRAVVASFPRLRSLSSPARDIRKPSTASR